MSTPSRALGDEPDPSHFPNPDECAVFTLSAGTPVVKVYNRREAEQGGAGGGAAYDRQDYNPVIVDDDAVPVVRGRFSSSRSARHAPPYADHQAYMYVASYADAADPTDASKHDEAIAVWEILDYHDLQVGPRPAYVSLLDLPVGYAFCYLELTRDLTILDITNARALEPFMAKYPGGIYGADYVLSRKWARHFRQAMPGIDGLAYVSTRFGPLDGRRAFVLYEAPPHVDASNEHIHGRVTLAVGDSVDLTETRGLKIVSKALGPAFIP